MIPLSILDLCPIIEGGTAGNALRNSLDLAQHAERWGYRRLWLAEHHNMPGIGSAATSVVIAHVAAGTETIRVGAGGVMLPNHAPLVVAEQFGTLEALFPGRIDLGLGRAPGTDPKTAYALRRNLASDVDQFPRDVEELLQYFREPSPGQPVRAVPGAGLHVPVWILGSSLFGAQLAAHLGLPYAFASHFAPPDMVQALELYRTRFEPSEHLAQPYVMLGFNVYAADDAQEAALLRTSALQSFVELRRGRPRPLPPPVEGYEETLSDAERQMLGMLMSCSAVGDPDTVRRELEAFATHTGADELIVVSHVYDHRARLRCFEIVAEAMIEASVADNA